MNRGEPIPIEPEQVGEDLPPPRAPLGDDASSGWLGWLCSNVILPLTPAMIGAAIRSIHGGLSVDILEPGELAFSLAMFCLLGAVSARRVSDPEYRDTAFTAFTIGVAFFMSMFAISVLKAAELETTMALAIQDLSEAVVNPMTASPIAVDDLAYTAVRHSTDETLGTILFFVGVLGLVFVVTALFFRDKYRLGEE